MKIIVYIIAGPLFLASIAAHIYVELRWRKNIDAELDEYYFEFEHQHPGYAKYLKQSRITLVAACIFALLVFLCAAI
jgi:hypothetical protein